MLFILVTSLYITVTATTDTIEYCQRESFNATCPKGKVILMETAQYGRMQVGRCLTINYEVGCYMDVLMQVDSRCSGKRTCTFSLVDKSLHNVKPCRQDLMSYLEASYSCVPAVELNLSTCSDGHMTVSQAEGFIVSNPFTSIPASCTVSIHVKVGQKIVLTMYDVYRFSRLNDPTMSDQCPVYAAIRERDQAHYIQDEVCRNQHSTRQVPVYTSGSHLVNVTVYSGQNAGHQTGVVMIKYAAIGCADIVAPPMMSVHRNKNTMEVTCNSTGVKYEKWNLVCKGNNWVGSFSNCTGKTKFGVYVGTKNTTSKDELHVGLLIAIALGVLLGVFSGFIFLLMAFLCRRRYIQNQQPVLTTLLSQTDHQGNMYKMVDVDAPLGEEPCYMCHHEATIYTKSGLDVPLSCGYTKPVPGTPAFRSQEHPAPKDNTQQPQSDDGTLYETNTTTSPVEEQHEMCGPGVIRHSQPADICMPATVQIYSGHNPGCKAGNLCHVAYTSYGQSDNVNSDSLGQKDGNASDIIYSFGQNEENSCNEMVNSFRKKTMIEKYPLPSVSLNAEVTYS